jgi:hypothetical protein
VKISVFAIVTGEDRLVGERRDCVRCPIAIAVTRAVRAALGRDVMAAVAENITLVFKDSFGQYGRRFGQVTIPMEPDVARYRNDYDDGFWNRLPRILVVEVPIPERLPEPNRRMVG